MKIIFATRDISNYKAAFYQRDFLSTISSSHEVKLLQEIYEVGPAREFKPDLLILGHEWLDGQGQPPFDVKQLVGAVPTVMILNKEYGFLEKKLEYYHEIGAKGLISHHHNLGSLSDLAPHRDSLHWMPFAANQRLFNNLIKEKGKPYNLNFSGVLRNPTHPNSQSDWRETVHRELFYTLNDYILTRKNALQIGRLRWIPITGNWSKDTWNRLRLGKLIQKDRNYAESLARSRLTLCTLSPLGLVGTRFFECALSNSGILVPADQDVQGLFPEEALFRFSSYEEMLQHVISGRERSPEYLEKTRIAKEFATKHHTWEARVDSFFDFVRDRILPKEEKHDS